MKWICLLNTALLLLILSDSIRRYFIFRINRIIYRFYGYKVLIQLEDMKKRGLRPDNHDCEKEYREDVLQDISSSSVQFGLITKKAPW